ncbi:MAG: hypothetical protein Q8T08_20330 [Ignavibacteria bacterium]|nr:hypothetical protein [Ignavibacteria bacterium]
MKQKQQIQSIAQSSQLERFNLGFEYDKTLRQVKNDVQLRTYS